MGVGYNPKIVTDGLVLCLDADLLDGQQGAFYTNATNITTGTLPYAQIPANIVNTTAEFTITGITTFNANVILGSSLTPSSNTILLGNSTQRWVLSGNTGNFSGDVTALNFNSTSDISLKINVRNIENPIEKINSIRGVNFNWKKDNTYTMGFVAQKIEQVLPELVSIQQDGTKTVSYGNITALLVEALKEQQKQIQSLSDKIEELENINKNKRS